MGFSSTQKFFVLLVVIFSHASADTHSVQYRYTAFTPGTDATAVGLLDGEQFVYYNSSIREMISKTEWIQKVGADDPDYWMTQTRRMKRDQEKLNQLFDTVMKAFNHSDGVHTLQRKYGCELYDNGTTRGHDRISYDGKDFLSLDVNTGSWTADNNEAEIFIKWWDPAGAQADVQKNYMENECFKWLKKYSKETMERKGGGLSRVQIAVLTVAVMAFVALLAGLLICNKCRSGHEGYVARTDILDLRVMSSLTQSRQSRANNAEGI